MFRFTAWLIVFVFSVGLAGCRACWGPYDHCQPTFVPEAGDKCMGDLYRNGSVLGGMDRRSNSSGCATCSGGGDSSDAMEMMPQNAPNMEEMNGTIPAADPNAAPSPVPYSPQGPMSEPISEPLPQQINQVPQPMNGSIPANQFIPTSQSELPEQFPLAEENPTM